MLYLQITSILISETSLDVKDPNKPTRNRVHKKQKNKHTLSL